MLLFLIYYLESFLQNYFTYKDVFLFHSSLSCVKGTSLCFLSPTSLSTRDSLRGVCQRLGQGYTNL